MAILHGFELVREQPIIELNTQARLFRHVKTGAELLSMENEDENKSFAITFRTPPSDSTGLPHIMEHSVLCGSRKCPVKEPFIELVKGSLQTFVNAFTGPDRTVYLLASQNLQDFYNLIDVYLDAVFYPNITRHTLQQEGWHYEVDGPAASMHFKGVVFNEMKGAYNDPDNLLSRYVQQSLFPDTPYGFDSGGDPAIIPDLTYEQFRQFHATYYHPSNARIFFYGDDPPDERLRLVNEYLQDFEQRDVDAAIPLQPRFAAPRRLVREYAVSQHDDAQGRRAMLTVNWLLAEAADTELALALDILGHILIGTPASPLRKALIDSGLGDDLAGPGMDPDLRQIIFSTGLKGIAPEDADRVEALVMDTLTRLAAEGIEPEMIEASVNTVEFALRENNSGQFPRGLMVGWRALRTWLHGGDPLAPLAFSAPLAAIKDRLARGERFFEALIGAYFLQNPHRTIVLLRPDPDLHRRQDAAERDRLDRARAAMSEAEVQRVIDDMHALKRIQETPDSPEALATIPALRLEDLDRQNKLIPLDILDHHGARVLLHDLPTNGIVYLDVGLDIHTLPAEYVPFVPLLGRALLEMGTQREDFVRLAQRIGRKTGGIEPNHFVSATFHSDQAAIWLFLQGKAMVDQADELLAILHDVLLTARLDDRDRFRQILLEEKASQEARLVPTGHAMVRRRLMAQLHEAGWAAEQMEGISYLVFLRELVDAVERDWPSVSERLEAMRHQLVNRRTMICNVTVDAASFAHLEPGVSALLAALPADPVTPEHWNPALAPVNEGLVIPGQVNYVGKGADLYELGYQFHGSIVPIANYLGTTWLWERVRMRGGAYGAFFSFDPRSGALTYLSYRDPNLLETIETYDRTGQFLRELALSQDELVRAIIGAIGAIDTYLLPDARGYTSMARYLIGESDERRQRMREDILATTPQDFRALADVLDQACAAGSVVVLGAQGAIERANAARPGWLRMTPVL